MLKRELERKSVVVEGVSATPHFIFKTYCCAVRYKKPRSLARTAAELGVARNECPERGGGALLHARPALLEPPFLPPPQWRVGPSARSSADRPSGRFDPLFLFRFCMLVALYPPPPPPPSSFRGWLAQFVSAHDSHSLGQCGGRRRRR